MRKLFVTLWPSWSPCSGLAKAWPSAKRHRRRHLQHRRDQGDPGSHRGLHRRCSLTTEIRPLRAGVRIRGTKQQFTIKGSNTGGSVSGAVYDHLNGFILNKRHQGATCCRAAPSRTTSSRQSPARPASASPRLPSGNCTGALVEIHVADFDGFNAQRLTSDNSISAGPDWHQTGHAVLLPHLKHNPDIYSHNIRTGQRRTVARFSGSNISPAVSRRKRVAMVLSNRQPRYLGRQRQRDRRRLTTTKAAESSLLVAGRRFICFVSRAGGRSARIKYRPTAGPRRTPPFTSPTPPSWTGHRTARRSFSPSAERLTSVSSCRRRKRTGRRHR